MSGTLYIVATPIGNLGDLSGRAADTLSSVDLIAAEDTRHTGRLLSHLGIKTPQISLHDHNEASVVSSLIIDLESGKSVALVSDAGTPLLSDPGYRLVSAAHDHDIDVSTVPGPSAITAALSVSGLPTDRCCFEGFLPSKRQARLTALESLQAEPRTLVFFESVHRVSECLRDLVDVFGQDRPAFIGRELTKLHEQTVRGDLGELLEALESGGIVNKGEFVIVVAGNPESDSGHVDEDRLLRALIDVLPGKQAASVAAKATGGKRNALYQRMLQLNSDKD